MLHLLQHTTFPEPNLIQTSFGLAPGEQTPCYSINKSHHSFGVLFSQPVGHGPAHIDEKYAVIILRAKVRDNNTYSLLQLPGIGGGEIRGERLSDI